MRKQFCVLETVTAKKLTEDGLDLSDFLSSLGVAADPTHTLILDGGSGMGSGPTLSRIHVANQVSNCRMVFDDTSWFGVLHGTDCQATQSVLATFGPCAPKTLNLYCSHLESGGLFEVVQRGGLQPDGTRCAYLGRSYLAEDEPPLRTV